MKSGQYLQEAGSINTIYLHYSDNIKSLRRSISNCKAGGDPYLCIVVRKLVFVLLMQEEEGWLARPTEGHQ